MTYIAGLHLQESFDIGQMGFHSVHASCRARGRERNVEADAAPAEKTGAGLMLDRAGCGRDASETGVEN